MLNHIEVHAVVKRGPSYYHNRQLEVEVIYGNRRYVMPPRDFDPEFFESEFQRIWDSVGREIVRAGNGEPWSVDPEKSTIQRGKQTVGYVEREHAKEAAKLLKH